MRALPFLALFLGACLPGAPEEAARALPDGGATEASVPAPEGAPPGTCWARDVAVAPVDALLAEALEVPAEGAVVVFETPCAYEMTDPLIASLQRALAARGAFDGPVSGQMDRATRQALRDWQRPRGIDSGVLAMATARALGLIPYPTEAGRRLKRLPETIPGPPSPEAPEQP